MATIQIRDVPEDVHRTYRRRASAAGMSLQQYLLGELIRSARTRSPAEVVAEVESQLAVEGPEGSSVSSSATVIRADRDAR